MKRVLYFPWERLGLPVLMRNVVPEEEALLARGPRRAGAPTHPSRAGRWAVVAVLSPGCSLCQRPAPGAFRSGASAARVGFMAQELALRSQAAVSSWLSSLCTFLVILFHSREAVKLSFLPTWL